MHELISHLGKSFPGRRKSKNKDHQWISKYRKKASMAGAQWERGETEGRRQGQKDSLLITDHCEGSGFYSSLGSHWSVWREDTHDLSHMFKE